MTDLILVPTPHEMKIVQPLVAVANEHHFALQICGFGPIAAAARTAALIARYQSKRVILIGIAGAYNASRTPVGSAHRFSEVACDGIGVGSGCDHQSASQMGWHQFTVSDAQPEIQDSIELDSWLVEGLPNAGKLLTVCSASANETEALRRLETHPGAVAEDMEGFGVAMSCALARVPLQIVRGISNRVGDRNHSDWRTEEALTAAAEMAMQLIPRTWMPSQS